MTVTSHISPDVFLHIPASLARRWTKSVSTPVEFDGTRSGGGNGRDVPPENTPRQFSNIRESKDGVMGSNSTPAPNYGPSKARLPHSRRQQQLTLVFFITGNPGLVGYYHPFLSLLVRDLENQKLEQTNEDEEGKDEKERNTSVTDNHTVRETAPVAVVAGFSLGGFEVENWPSKNNRQHRRTSAGDRDDRDGPLDVGNAAEGRDEQPAGPLDVRNGDTGTSEATRAEESDKAKEERKGRQIEDLLYPPFHPGGPLQYGPNGGPPSLSEKQNAQSHENDHGAVGPDDRAKNSSNSLYSLRDQIELSYARIERLVDTLRKDYYVSLSSMSSRTTDSPSQEGRDVKAGEQGRKQGQDQHSEDEDDREDEEQEQLLEEPINVVLVGHSVGAYIALEIVRLWHERHPHGQSTGSMTTTRTKVTTTTCTTMDTSNSNTTTGTNGMSASAVLDPLSQSSSPHNRAPPSWTSQPSHPAPTSTPTQSSASTDPGTTVLPWTISGCILLTPTIMDIHRSRSGRLATPLLTSFLRPLPFPFVPCLSVPPLAHRFLHSVLVNPLPTRWLAWLVGRATRMKQGTHGFEATLAFLKSPRGVEQALHMAAHEMREIRADKWGEEVWGVAEAASARDHGSVEAVDGRDIHKTMRSAPGTKARPKLYFWFAKSDHWVADVTREEIQKNRGAGVVERDDVDVLRKAAKEAHPRDSGADNTEEREGGSAAPMVRIYETDGLAHAWCLDQSELVAQRVSRWLRDILHGLGGVEVEHFVCLNLGTHDSGLE